MVTSDDLIRLRFPSELTQAGVDYACRSLAFTYDRMGGSPFARMRRIAIGKAVELGFRRFLDSEGAPYDNLGATPFTEPDHYDIALGGRRCDLKSFQILHRPQIQELHRSPDGLLDADALVPEDQLLSEHFGDHDLYLFAFATALTAFNPDDVKLVQQANQPLYWIFPFPERWGRPKRWKSLGRLALKLEVGLPLAIEVGGQNASKGFQSERVTLIPGKPLVLQQEFYSVGYIHVDQLPVGKLGIRSRALDETFVVEARRWENIWIYGMSIFLAGCMPRGEFRQRASRLPHGSRVWQYARTRTSNWGMPVRMLYPISELLERARNWNGGRP